LSDFSSQKIRQIIYLSVISVNSSDHRERARTNAKLEPPAELVV